MELLTYLGFLIDENDLVLPDTSLKQSVFTFHMLGYDIGAAVSASFTDLYQNRVGLLCVRGLDKLPAQLICVQRSSL